MSASAVLLRSSSIFLSSSLPLFLLLSAVLFSFRSAVHLGSLSLSSALDRDPHLRSLLSRLPTLNPHNHHHLNHNHHPPLLVSDPLLSEIDDPLHLQQSSSLLNPPLFSNLSILLLLHPNNPQLTVLTLRSSNHHHSSPVLLSSPPDRSAPLHISNLDRRDALSLLYIVSLFSLAHLYSICGFLLSYSCAFGVVCFAATGSLLNRRGSFFRDLYAGSRLGFRRLPLLLFLRWSLRDAILQFLCLVFFSEVRDQFSLLKLFVKVKLIPFSLTALPPSIQSVPDVGSLKGFISMWTLLDMPVSIVFAVNCWVAVMDRSERRSGREVVKEGCYLVSSMIGQVGAIKFLEMMVCGNFGMRVMSVVGVGQVSAMVAQSVAEVYFMVVWLMLYFSARLNVGNINGRRFGWTELEDLYDSLREDRQNE